MSTCSTRAATRALPTPVQLRALAEILDAGPLPPATDGPATLVRLRSGHGGRDLELGVAELGDAHPADVLVGLDAPADWLAIGVVGHGRLRALDDGAGAGAGAGGAGEGGRAVLGHGRHVLLVARGGAWATRLTRDDGRPPYVDAGRGPVGGPVGLLADACRRTLALATPPPPADTSPLWAALWLDAVVAAGTASCSWSEVAVQHPAARLLLAAAPDPVDPTRIAAELVGLARRLAGERTWSALRDACGAGRWPVPGLAPADAGWFDLGAFARRVLAELPSLAFLRPAAGELLGEAARTEVDRALAAWGLLDPATGRLAAPW